MKNVPVGATIEPDLNKKLEECMREEDRSRSQIVRKAIMKYVEAEKNTPVVAWALVDLMTLVNKIQREYAEVIEAEDLALLNEKLALVLAAERG